jgi:hypothetical protein
MDFDDIHNYRKKKKNNKTNKTQDILSGYIRANTYTALRRTPWLMVGMIND